MGAAAGNNNDEADYTGGGIRDISAPTNLGGGAAAAVTPTGPTRLGPQIPSSLLPHPTTAPDSDPDLNLNNLRSANSGSDAPTALMSTSTQQQQQQEESLLISRRPVPAPAPPIPSVVVHASATSGPTTLVVGRSLTDNVQPPYHHQQQQQQFAPSSTTAVGGSSTSDANAGNTIMQTPMPLMPFSTPDPTLRTVPAPAAPTIVPPSSSSSSSSYGMSHPSEAGDSSPTDAFIPIMHRRVPSPPPPLPPVATSTTNKTKTRIAIPPIPPSPDSDDDGFTPVTPGSAGGVAVPRRGNTLKSPGGGGGGMRAFDALGIPIVARGILGRVRSRKVTIVDPSKEEGYHDDGDGDGDGDGGYEDDVPLTPAGARDRDLEKGGVGGGGNGNGKTMRRTLFGLIEGWWDLGLLEKGKSLRRKG